MPTAQLCAINVKENKKTLQFDRRKSKATAVSLLLMFAMVVSIVALPTATAQSTRKTYAFIGASPNPIGVGQEVLFHVGITQELAHATMGWEGLSITITRPDDVVETLSDIKTDATGGTGRVYVPDQVGNYTLQGHFPEQVIPPGGGAGLFGTTIPDGTVMLASDSEELTLVVQEEPLPDYPGNPLPTEYWSRPIDAQLREWSVISGNWLGYHRYSAPLVPGNDGPETGHILWAKPLAIGGLVGGLVGEEMGDVAFELGDAYEGKFDDSIIIAGKLYYRDTVRDRPLVYHCADLHTGEELWAKTFLDNRTIAFGQLHYFKSFNYQGTFAYLWVTVGSTWYAFDAFTGDWRFTVENVPSGTTLSGSRGGIHRLQVDLTNGWMALWNLTALGTWSGTGYHAGGSWGNCVHMKTLDAAANTTAAQLAWEWNVTIPKGLPGSVREASKLPQARPAALAPIGDRVIGASVTSTEVTVWGLSLEPGREGTLLFNNTWKAPSDWAKGIIFGGFGSDWTITSLEDRVGILFVKEERRYYGFSLETGAYIWKTEPEPYLNLYGSSRCGIAYGRLFTVGYSGMVHCYNVTTGELLWKYEAYDPYNEILWSNNWPLYMGFITDGKIYVHHAEHSGNQPLPRGAPFTCVDVETGELVFELNIRGQHWGGNTIIGDSIIAMYNTYDQRIWAIGKGPSATTVTAAPEVSVHGSSVLVKGMVTDISPGTEEYSKTARFPNGVPAVCDENMSDWMEYVYIQKARPADVVGVEVVLEVLDPNNNFYEVGRTTSDASGMFHCAFTPEVPGEYTIIATFEGSEAYWPSYAETAINVEEAPAATPAPTPTPAPMTDTYILGIGSAILIAVIIGFALLFMLLRKR
jgi:outer membrane protein assembly factor BamB